MALHALPRHFDEHYGFSSAGTNYRGKGTARNFFGLDRDPVRGNRRSRGLDPPRFRVGVHRAEPRSTRSPGPLRGSGGIFVPDAFWRLPFGQEARQTTSGESHVARVAWHNYLGITSVSRHNRRDGDTSIVWRLSCGLMLSSRTSLARSHP